MKKILAAGFNPAWQKVLTFSGIKYGNVNRAAGIETFASGKGINFCRAAKCFGKAETHLLQFCGGINGTRLETALHTEKIIFESVRTSAETRCCNTCIDLDSGKVTELIEPSFPAAGDEVDLFIKKYSDALQEASAAAFCGTLPSGTDCSLYGKLARIAAAQGVPLLIDAWRDVEDVFASGAEIWLKINKEELTALTGCAELQEGLLMLTSRWQIRKAAITDGSGQAFAYDGEKTVAYTLPELDRIVNPIGCGDTAGAVLCSQMINGADWFSAFKNALGAASANCLSSLCGSFSLEDAKKIADSIKCTEL